MASKPPVECPLCHRELKTSHDLEDHLVEEHSLQELADHIVAQWESTELGDIPE